MDGVTFLPSAFTLVYPFPVRSYYDMERERGTNGGLACCIIIFPPRIRHFVYSLSSYPFHNSVVVRDKWARVGRGCWTKSSLDDGWQFTIDFRLLIDRFVYIQLTTGIEGIPCHASLCIALRRLSHASRFPRDKAVNTPFRQNL